MTLFLAQTKIPEITDIREPVYIWDTFQLSIIGGLIALLLLVGLLWVLKRKSSPPKIENRPPPIPPFEWATLRLNQILETEKELSDPDFTAAVGDVLRGYIERAFEHPALEQTTEEFLLSIQSHPVFNRELSQRTGAFLTQCDLIKFAQQQIELGQRPELIQTARQFVDTAESSRQLSETNMAKGGSK